MPTTRLFDDDPYRLDFVAAVVGVRSEGPAVALDASAFFPEDGGQKADRGTIEGVAVTGLSFDPEGTIWHTMESDPGWKIGTQVRGQVDPAMRRDHRQQHTGQHILSRVIEELYGAETVSFHMGDSSCTIDLQLETLGDDAIAAVEDAANGIVLEDREVKVAAQPREGNLPLRTVAIEGFDAQHCCGTHVRRTGEVGAIKILRVENTRGLLRVYFACGERAIRLFRRVASGTDRMARRFSAGWFDIPDLVDGVMDRTKELEKQVRLWRKRWLVLEAGRLARETERIAGGVLWVATWIEGADAEGLREAANEILAKGDAVAVLAGPGDPGRSVWVVARTDLPDAARFDARELLREILSPLGGRGGGTAAFAQGSCPVDEAACRDRLSGLRPPRHV